MGTQSDRPRRRRTFPFPSAIQRLWERIEELESRVGELEEIVEAAPWSQGGTNPDEPGASRPDPT